MHNSGLNLTLNATRKFDKVYYKKDQLCTVERDHSQRKCLKQIVGCNNIFNK